MYIVYAKNIQMLYFFSVLVPLACNAEIPRGFALALGAHRSRAPHACEHIANTLAWREHDATAHLFSAEPLGMGREQGQNLLPYRAALPAPSALGCLPGGEGLPGRRQRRSGCRVHLRYRNITIHHSNGHITAYFLKDLLF